MSIDFTFEKYKELCQTIVSSQYQVLTVNRYIENPSISRNVIILRHDVDRKPQNALKIAKLEKSLQLSSTYYFRKKKNTFKPRIIEEIARLGHEVGYHYESLAKARGNFEEAIEIFESELSEFRKICEVKTICMHGSSYSKWNNRDLWGKYDFRKFGLIGEVYLSIDYDKVIYLNDTGRTWDSQRYNLRDKVDKNKTFQIETTDDLVSFLKARTVSQLCLQTHPDRWADSKIEWIEVFLFDFLINQVKMGIKFLRG